MQQPALVEPVMNTPNPSSSPEPSTVSSDTPGAPVRFTWAALKRSTLFYPFIGLLVVCIVMVFASDSFLSGANIENVLRQVSINAISGIQPDSLFECGGEHLSRP